MTDKFAGKLIIRKDVVPEYAISIHDKEDALVVGVRRDGSIKYGEGFTKEESAKRFWEEVSLYMPKGDK